MLRTAYFAATETVPSLSAVKRAIMTYDRVLLPDPADRDFIPPQSFFMAVGMPSLFGSAEGDVRLLGKHPNYDVDFQHLIDHLTPAIKDGVVDIVSTYKIKSSQKVTLGGVDLGGFPVSPQKLLWTYRAAAREQDLLVTCVKDDQSLLKLTVDKLHTLTCHGGMADVTINQDPKLPDLESDFLDETRRPLISNIARARLATIIKSIAYCAVTEMTPLFSQSAYRTTILEMSKRSSDFIDVASEHDPYWIRRNRVLDLAYSEYLDDKKIETLSTQDCLGFRTTNWGKQIEKRDNLLNSASMIAKELADQPDFESKVQEDIASFHVSAESVKAERKRLGFDIKCDLTELGARSGLAGIAGHAAGNLAQLQTGVGVATFLLTACVLAAPKVKNWSNESQNLRRLEEELSDTTCLGIHSFFN